MAPFVITLLYFLILLWIGLRRNWKNGSRREFWVSAVFLTAGFIILALASFDIYLPSPFIPVKWIIHTIFNFK